MAVIRASQLVLDDQNRVVGCVTADEIECKRPDRMLGPVELDIDPQRVGKAIRVGQEPGGEVVRLMIPEARRMNSL